jgi:hypothetical protein
MDIRKMGVEFISVFAIALVTGALVTFLWNTIVHAERSIEKQSSYIMINMPGDKP